MSKETAEERVTRALQLINGAWSAGRIEEMEPVIHPKVVLAMPGFTAREVGRDSFLAGHRQFYQSATIHQLRELDVQVDVVDETAVATYRYELIYERSGSRYRSTGRDLWVFELRNGECRAVWRTVLDVEESSL